MTERRGSQERETLALLDQTGQMILDLWQRTRMDWGFVATRLSQAFREERLGSQQRRFVAETVYGLVRHLRRIDEALALAGVNFHTRAPDRERLIAYLALEGAIDAKEASRLVPEVDWPLALTIDAVIAEEKSESVRLARRHSFPDWIAETLLADHGSAAEPLMAALNERAPMTIRTNTLAVSRSELLQKLAEEDVQASESELGPWALSIENRINLFALDAFQKGLFEAQDVGSQLIAELVAPPPKAVVVDYCAGAGGKTLAMAALMADSGRIVASDPDPKKLTELKRRARRAKVSNTQAVEISSDFAAPLPTALEGLVGRAHRVLLDVPCTGLGALRRNPEIRWRLEPSALTRMPALQGQLIDRAVEFLRPGGRLIYATCSVFHAENRQVVAAAQARHPKLELVPVKEIWGKARAEGLSDETGTFLEVLPHRQGSDGFFAAVLRPKE